MKRLLLVMVGSGFGGGARYLFSGWAIQTLGAAFPYGTIAINAVGSFLIAGVMFLGMNTDLISPDLRLALTTGVLGGFTTYSTFNHESLSFFQEGAWMLGALNVAATVLLCLGCGWLGVLAGRWFVAGS